MARQRNVYASLKYLYSRFSGQMPIVPEFSFDNNKQLQVRAAANDRDWPLIGNDASDITQLGNPNGVNALAFSTTQLATPGTPVVTVVGTAGSTTWAYKIVAKSGNGSVLGVTAASAAGSTSTGNATLSTTNYNTITWAAVAGAASYDIYRTTAAGTPSTTGKIGSLTAQIISESTVAPTFNDTGIAGDSATAPTVNTTGAVIVNGPMVTTGNNLEPQIVTTISTAGAGTYTAAQLINGLILRDCGAASRTDTTDTAAAIVAALPGAAVNSSFEFDVRNISSSTARIITLAAGTGVTLATDGTFTIAQGLIRRFQAVITNVGTPAVTIYPFQDLGVIGQAGPLLHNMGDFAIATSNAALTAAQMIDGIIRVTAGTNTNATDSAANIVAAIPNCVVGSTFLMTVINGSGNAETLTLGSGVTAASGVTVTLTIATATCKQYLFRVTNVGTPAVTIYEIGASTL